MRNRRRIKRSTKQYIIVAIICVTLIGGASLILIQVLKDQMMQEYNQRLEFMNKENSKNIRTIYVAEIDIDAGETIAKEHLSLKTVYASQPIETYINEDSIGKTALLDIPSGTHIQRIMLTDNKVTSELREVEYDVILLNTNIAEDDYIDVRIMYPNGEDYIILSKKEIKKYLANDSISYLWLSEEEILRMASAIVDAYLYSGAKLYTTRYIEPNLQGESQITYKPSVATLLLIQDNPNIMDTAETELSKQVRKAMENRLAASMTTNVKDINWTINNKNSEYEDKPKDINSGINSFYQEEKDKKENAIDYGP